MIFGDQLGSTSQFLMHSLKALSLAGEVSIFAGQVHVFPLVESICFLVKSLIFSYFD